MTSLQYLISLILTETDVDKYEIDNSNVDRQIQASYC